MNAAFTIFAHLHPVVVHGPIALVLGLFAMEAWFRLRKKAPPVDAALFLVVIGALSALIAVGSGLALASTEEFHGKTAMLLEQHRNLGIIAAIWATAAAAALVAFTRRTDARLRIAYGVALGVAALAVSATGHRGGQLVHGEDYLLPEGERGGGDDGPLVGSDGDDETGSSARERWPDDPSILQRGERVDFARDVAPIFERSCNKCHGPERRRGKLRLDQKKYAMHGGESGEVIVPGDPEASLLIKMVSLPSTDEDVMPSKGKLLSPSEIELLKKWIREGAHWSE